MIDTSLSHGADLVEVLSVGAVEQRLEDDDRLVEVPDKHSVDRVYGPTGTVLLLLLATVHFTG